VGDETFDFSLPLHLKIKPPKPRTTQQKLQFNPAVRQLFVNRGLTLSGAEMRSLMAGRAQGIQTLERILAKTPVTQSMAPDKRKGLAADIADAFMEKSLEAQLSREAPTALDLNRERNEKLQHVLVGRVVREFPLKAQITIHLPVSWL
jgi:hypothetical protein